MLRCYQAGYSRGSCGEIEVRDGLTGRAKRSGRSGLAGSRFLRLNEAADHSLMGNARMTRIAFVGIDNRGVP